jgi:cell division septum initiation protein DivIVA
VADSRIKGRVKGLLGGASPDDAHVDLTPGTPDPDAQRQALQVLTLAQRTADEHIASAQHQADDIRAAARASAEQIARDAHAHVEAARREAGKAVADARAMAEQIARDAQAHADGARRDAEKLLADARAKATEIAKDAQTNAAGLEREAQQRYDDVVGSLETKRAALQQQIEALQQFDRDYRSRLRTFMKGQLHALGDEDPHSNVPIPQRTDPHPGPIHSQARSHSRARSYSRARSTPGRSTRLGRNYRDRRLPAVRDPQPADSTPCFRARRPFRRSRRRLTTPSSST